MAHPYAGFRQSKVEHSRAEKYADGGAVEEAKGKLVTKLNERNARMDSASAVDRDRMRATEDAVARGSYKNGSYAGPFEPARRASGGRTNKPKGTNVNVIITGHGANPAPMAAGAGAPPPPPVPAPRPPMPMGGPPMPPGGPGPQPPRSQGGRAFARGGAVKAASLREGTQVKHLPQKNDLGDVGRKRVITYKTGGAVEAPKGEKGMSPHMPGGARGGMARIAKEHRAAKTYAKPK